MMTRKSSRATKPADPNSDPPPHLPPPSRPTPGPAKPGDPPGQPRPGDPPPQEPKPGSPGPVRPQTAAVLLLSLTLSLSLIVPPGLALAQPAHSAVADNDILEAIESELRWDDVVSADSIDVTVDEGVVTLSGKTPTLLAKRRAIRLVGSLKGVRSVVDGAEVVPSGRSDEQIFADVQAALRDDPVADEESIQVTVGLGRVKLVGMADSFAETRLVENTVAGVRGVTEIDNQIKVIAKNVRPDDEIKPEILRRFELNPYLAEGLIEVQVEDGAVTLGGVVGSVNEKNIAGLMAWVAGVRSVDNSQLEVNWWQDPQRRRDSFSVVRNDVELQHAVQDALLYDPRVRGMEIDARVRDAAVSLLGNVPSLSAKRAAEQDAQNTLGVRRVINHLKVKDDEWPGDEAVTKQAQEALARDPHLAGFDLKVSSHFGKLYLSGDVNTHFERQRAETVAANVPHAVAVVNRLNVDTRWTPKPDDDIHEDAARRLRWSPLLDAENIELSVAAGAVTLRGTVDTWHQRRMAEQHAHQAGARRVINKLEVHSRRTTPTGLKATLLPKQSEYELQPAYQGDDFRRLLARAKSIRDTSILPPAPEVDLVYKLLNEADQPIDVRLGHDRGEFELSLTGKGAVHVKLDRTFSAEFRPGRIFTIEPGRELELPIRSLQYGFRNASERWYWTQPGEYSLQATLTWPEDEAGLVMQAVAATPVRLTVKSPDTQNP